MSFGLVMNMCFVDEQKAKGLALITCIQLFIVMNSYKIDVILVSFINYLSFH
jgi:hypothetical protein